MLFSKSYIQVHPISLSTSNYIKLSIFHLMGACGCFFFFCLCNFVTSNENISINGIHHPFERVSKWLLFNANSAIFQLYPGEKKLILNEMMMKSALYINQHAELHLYSASSLKYQSTGRHVAPLGHIILIPSKPVFALSP